MYTLCSNHKSHNIIIYNPQTLGKCVITHKTYTKRQQYLPIYYIIEQRYRDNNIACEVLLYLKS